jgi:hypothetical protein
MVNENPGQGWKYPLPQQGLKKQGLPSQRCPFWGLPATSTLRHMEQWPRGTVNSGRGRPCSHCCPHTPILASFSSLVSYCPSHTHQTPFFRGEGSRKGWSIIPCSPSCTVLTSSGFQKTWSYLLVTGGLSGTVVSRLILQCLPHSTYRKHTSCQWIY